MSVFAYANKAKCDAEFMEDAVYVGNIGKYVILMVADGNGTASGQVDSGILATSLATDWLNHLLLNPDGSEKELTIQEVGQQLELAMFGLSRCYITMNALDERYSTLYCSLIISVIDELSLDMITASIGNCEIHRVRNGQDELLNKVHSEAYESYKSGKLPEEEWRSSPKRGILTSALGKFDEPMVDILQSKLEPEDIIFMTTDGLLHVTGPAGILDELFDNAEDISQATDAVLDRAAGLKCPDNCALVVGYVIDDVRGRTESNYSQQPAQPRYSDPLGNDVNNAHGDVRARERQERQVQRRSGGVRRGGRR